MAKNSEHGVKLAMLRCVGNHLYPGLYHIYKIEFQVACWVKKYKYFKSTMALKACTYSSEKDISTSFKMEEVGVFKRGEHCEPSGPSYRRYEFHFQLKSSHTGKDIKKIRRKKRTIAKYFKCVTFVSVYVFRFR